MSNKQITQFKIFIEAIGLADGDYQSTSFLNDARRREPHFAYRHVRSTRTVQYKRISEKWNAVLSDIKSRMANGDRYFEINVVAREWKEIVSSKPESDPSFFRAASDEFDNVIAPQRKHWKNRNYADHCEFILGNQAGA